MNITITIHTRVDGHTLTRRRVESWLQGNLPQAKVLTIEGDGKKFLVVNGHVQEVVRCESCGEEVVGAGARYCPDCLDRALERDEYYHVDQCVAFVGTVGRDSGKWAEFVGV